jgi:hypothetical protein
MIRSPIFGDWLTILSVMLVGPELSRLGQSCTAEE